MEEKEIETSNQEEVLKENIEEVKPKKEYVIPLPPSEKEEPQQVEINKPPHWMMRIAGGLIDLCIIFLAMIGFKTLFMSTPMGEAYNFNYTEAVKVSDKYKLMTLIEGSDETFGYIMYEGEEGYEDLVKSKFLVYTDEDSGAKYVVANHENISKDLQTAFQTKVKADEQFKNYTFNMRFIEFGIYALAFTCSEIIFLLGIPLLNKGRMTIGKFASGTMLINSKYQVEAKWYQVVGRFFWILIVESLLPIFFISSVLIAPLIVSPILLLVTFTNKDRRTIHDFICRTKVIDKRTFTKLSEQ